MALASLAAHTLGAPRQAEAAPSAAEQLVAKYAPILLVRKQENPPCDTSEEQYEPPTTVNVVLGNPQVVLERVVKKKVFKITTAPTAADIAGRGSDYYLNLPGDPVESECTYARDFAALKRAGKAPAVTYAHIATEPGHGGFVVQYWFFWYFNQFNDLHEGDWEGMQIVFDTGTPETALVHGPSEIALFQHGGGETADWDDSKVQKRGTHPVVYPAAGSHATFFDDSIYLQTGQGGAGLGCDNTSKPLTRVDPRPELVPTDPVIGGPDQWLTYVGHWGQKEPSYNNGPTGPITKTQWSDPFTWMDGARLASPKLPSGGLFGGAAASAFCGTVAAVSSFINAQTRSRLGTLLVVAIIAALVILPVVLTRWWPVDLSELRRARAFGQLMRAARQLYGRHWRTFVTIGLTAIPILGAIELAQTLFTDVTGSRHVAPSVTIGGLHLEFSLTISGTFRPFGFAMVSAAAVAAVRMVDQRQAPSAAEAWLRTLQRIWRLLGVQILTTVYVWLMAITVIGIPFAFWKYFSWQLVQQQVIFEDKSIREAMRGSSRLVRHHWWRTFRTCGFLTLLTFASGPVLGFFLIFADLSLVWVNIISSLVYMLLVPYEAIGRTLLYFDLGARRAAAAEAPARRRRPPWQWFRPRPSPQAG